MKHANSEQLLKDHADYILPVINFEKPILERGKGSYVYDVDGNKIMDLNGGQFCNILGHSNPKFVEMMSTITNSISHTSTSTLTTQVLAVMKKINGIMPEMNAKNILLATGAEAVEFALRYSKHITQKNGVVSFSVGYHGLTLGAQTVTYAGVHAKPWVKEAYSIETPKNLNGNDDYSQPIKKLAALCSENEIACVILEPIVSVGGMYVQTKEFLEQVKVICEENNVILIYDECQTGFGRTGKWFGYQSVCVTPHIMVTAKGFGLGYPISMVSVDSKYVDGCPPLVHFSSHQNDPFSAMVVDFGIEYIIENNLLTNVELNGKYFYEKLDELHENNDHFSKPRGKGLMLGCDLQIEGVSDYRKISADFREYLLLEHNLMIQATNGGRTLRFLPSFEISKEEIDKVVFMLDLASREFLRVRK